MIKKLMQIIFGIMLVAMPSAVLAVDYSLGGRILLQVESHGEAWYVSPLTNSRYYLGRPADAFRVMRDQGVGISNSDLAKIPKNTDSGLQNFDFVRKHKGKIFLAVEDAGQAWYVNPLDLRRYYLGRPADAYALLRLLGLGISNADLRKINIAGDSPIMPTLSLGNEDYSVLEKIINELINQERIKNNLAGLVYSDAIAMVAREHSDNLAKENKLFTSIGKICDLPIIHHEGLDFGITHSDRLKSRGIYDYSRSGENIALITRLEYSIEYMPGGSLEKELSDCDLTRKNAEINFKAKIDGTEDAEQKLEIIRKEIAWRTDFFNDSSAINPIEIEHHGYEQIAQKTVSGWMESPGHKKNILTAEYDTTGIGVAFIDGYIIATQVFTKKAECGYLNGPCCESGGCFLPYACDADKTCK